LSVVSTKEGHSDDEHAGRSRPGNWQLATGNWQLVVTAIVGNPERDAITLRDASGLLVSGATWATAYAKRADGGAFAPDVGAETAPGSGVYPVTFTPVSAQPHHLWLTATKGTGFVQHWAASTFPVTGAVPVERLVGKPQEDLLVLLDGAGEPIAGAAFAVVAGSVVAPAGDPFAPVVAATERAGAYLVRATPVVAGYRRAELATTNVTPARRYVVAYTAMAAGPPVAWTPVIGRGGSVAWIEG
jgi:hypothetical protein